MDSGLVSLFRGIGICNNIEWLLGPKPCNFNVEFLFFFVLMDALILAVCSFQETVGLKLF